MIQCISFNTVELDCVDLPNYKKIKLLIGDCGFYINEIEGMYLDVIGRNLLKKLYHGRNIILAQSNVLWLKSCFFFSVIFIDKTCFIYHVCLYLTIVCIHYVYFCSFMYMMPFYRVYCLIIVWGLSDILKYWFHTMNILFYIFCFYTVSFINITRYRMDVATITSVVLTPVVKGYIS